MNNIPCITQYNETEEKFYSVEIRNSMLKHFVYPDKNLFAFHTPYIPTDPVQFEFENLRGR